MIKGDSWGTGNKMYNDMQLGNISVYDSPLNKGRIPIVALISGQDIKFILQWGTLHPYDLDFHVVGKLPTGEQLNGFDAGINGDSGDNTLFHVCSLRPNLSYTPGAYSWQQQFSAKNNTFLQGPPDPAPIGQNYFPKNIMTTTALTQDANSGYGSEAINFYSGYKNGTYWFTVVNWSVWYSNYYSPATTRTQEQWTVTNASIQVYDANGLTFELYANPPSGPPADTNYEYVLWQAFKMNISGNGPAARQFEVSNTFVPWLYHTGTYDMDKRNLDNF